MLDQGVVHSAFAVYHVARHGGQLAVAVPIRNSWGTVIGLAATGIDLALESSEKRDLAYSEDRQDRAAAAVMACSHLAELAGTPDP